MEFLKTILQFIRSFFFVQPREALPLDKDYDNQIDRLIGLINHERTINGMMKLDEIHELNVVALDSARFNYQNYRVDTKPSGLTLQFRLMKQEYPVNNSGEIVIDMCNNAEEAFNKMKIDRNSREVMHNGYFCHIGVGKCGCFWTAIFAQPRY